MPNTDGLAVTAPATANRRLRLWTAWGSRPVLPFPQATPPTLPFPHLAADGGYEFSSQESTAGSSYQEYSIEEVTCVLTNNFYEAAPNEPWPLITYMITLKRADYYCAPPQL